MKFLKFYEKTPSNLIKPEPLPLEHFQLYHIPNLGHLANIRDLFDLGIANFGFSVSLPRFRQRQEPSAPQNSPCIWSHRKPDLERDRMLKRTLEKKF